VSEQSRDESELQAFLAGESALSRRYKESNAEAPPGHVDAAILAASRWAVGADRNIGVDSSPGAAKKLRSNLGDADSRPEGAGHAAAKWRNNFSARWRIPLAMAAVVVVAATLTLMIEDDPEIDRIRQRYDDAAAGKGAQSEPEATVEERSVAPDEQQPAAASPTVSAKPAAPAPATTLAEKDAAKRKVEQKEAATTVQARKAAEPIRSERLQLESATDTPVARQASEPRPRASAAASPVTAEQSAPASANNAGAVAETESETDGVVTSLADADDDATLAGAITPPAINQTIQPEEIVSGREQAFTQTPDTALATASAPGESAALTAADTLRDPAQWIKDIDELLAQGKRADAIDSLKAFRREYPDYPLPLELHSLLPADSD